ncbi:MAG TPA: hypothetical protein VGC96_04805 [Candidatus Elarobacter sp.]
MRTLIPTVLLFIGTLGAAADGPLERWENAVGGRDKVAAIASIYREASLEYAGYGGTLKVWHTADGKYRKEERVARYSLVETFDGTNGMVQQGDGPPHTMKAAEQELATSRRFANANAMFFAFFPERRHGTVTAEDANTVVLSRTAASIGASRSTRRRHCRKRWCTGKAIRPSR